MSPQPAKLRAPALLSPKARRKLRRENAGTPKHIIPYYVKNYPATVLASLAALIAAGLVESVGLAALLPVLGELTGSKASLPAPLDQWLKLAFELVGIEPTLNVLLILVIGLLLTKIAMGFLVMVFVGWVQARVTGELRNRLITSLGNARWSYFARQASGRAANALLSEAAKSAGGLTTICQLIAALTQVLIFAAMASLISWKATLIALFASLVSVGVLTRLIRLLRRNQRERIIASSNMTARLVDSLSNMKTLKAMSAERRMTKLIARDIASIRRNANIGVALNEGITSLQELIKLLALLGAFFFLFMIANQPLELILVVLVLFMRVMQSAASAQNKYKGLVACEAPFEHVQALIADAVADEEDLRGEKEPSLTQRIRIEGVSFAYEHERILDRVTLDIPAGTLVCLSGPSGSGKTTLMDIVCGLLKPQDGDVFIDGVPLSEINVRRWRRQIGYVPQELILFHDTLLANVTLGDDRIPTGEVEQALRAAGAWNFVETLHEGLDTIVGERGIRFSGGQRQRISIARALVRRPRLLILDEATASLDPATEKELCKTLAGLRGQVTMLAATHQAALNQVADAVYRIQNGRLDQVHPDVAALEQAK
jgi:ATP-binding cassette subfamily C protein